MTIYVVTSGEYSDYGIRMIFLRKEDAEKYVALENKAIRSSYDECRIEEHEAVEQLGEAIVLWTARQYVYNAGVEIVTGRPVEDSESVDSMIFWDGAVPDHFKERIDEVEEHEIWRGRGKSIHVTSFDRETAVKKAAERATRLRAEREGIA